MLPTEREPAVRFEVPRETLRQALRELVLEGRLRRAGRGTVVSWPTPRSSSTTCLSPEVQQEVSAVGGGFTARKDVRPADAHAKALAALMKDVEVFQPDGKDIDKNLDAYAYVDAWKTATGS